MPEWVPVNLRLMSHPLNWFIVFFMVTLAMVPVALLAETIHTAPKKKEA